MADYTNLKQQIAAAIRANGEGAITGPVLQEQLLDMVDAIEVDTWDGLITEDTVPPTDTNKPHVFLAVTEGYYEDFDLTVEEGDIWLVARMADEVEWTKTNLAEALQAKLVNTPDYETLGFAKFSTVRAYNIGDKVYKDNEIYRFVSDKDAGEWDAARVEPWSIEQEIEEVDGAIRSLIPAQASADNQLADKEYVNDKVSTDTATFRGTFNLVTDLSLTTEATQGQIATDLGTAISGEDKNDYAFVQIPTSDATPTEIARIDRYKYNGLQWAFEYSINNSGFTAEQWAAINSGITSSLVAAFGDKYDKPAGGIPASDMNTSTFDDEPTAGSNNPVKSGGVFNELALGAVYDVSAHNNNTTFASLEALLSDANLNTIIPTAVRKGGMSIKFVQTSDNKYVQYFLTKNVWSASEADWEKMNLEEEVSLLGQYIENQEYIRVYTDADGKFVWGIKVDGSIEWAVGVPTPVQNAINEVIPMLASKVDKENGKSLISRDFASKISYIDNGEYRYLMLDDANKIVFAIKENGDVYLPIYSNKDAELSARIDEINAVLANNDITDKEELEIAFIGNNLDTVISFLQPGDYGIWYGNAGEELIFKTQQGGTIVWDDLPTLTKYKYNYAGIQFTMFKAEGYVMPQLCEYLPKVSHDVVKSGHISTIDTMPDYSGETWDWSKTTGVYTIMSQVYEYMDALCLAYPNIVTKYDPMCTEAYTDGGVTVNPLPSIRNYMSQHGFSAYPFWYDGCQAGEYDITVGSNVYHATLKATPAFRTFVYKFSQADQWYMYKQDNRRVRRRILYVQAGVHGYENMGPVAAAHLAKELVSGSRGSYETLANYDVYILPCLDGYNILHGDYDGAYGTNANRNYPTPWWRSEESNWGLAAGDYFVTRLACAFIDTLKPDVAFDVHDQTPAVRDFGYFECGLHYTTHEMYQVFAKVAEVVRKTQRFEQYFGTKNQIPLMRNQDFACNAAHAHDYFFANGIRCAGVLELPSGINYTAQSDGTCVYGRVTANDFNVNTWELAALLMINYTYGMANYNLNNF